MGSLERRRWCTIMAVRRDPGGDDPGTFETVSHIRLHRPARMVSPPSPGEEIVVRLPPPLDEGPGFGWWQLLFPAVTGLGSLVFVAVNPTPTYAALTGVIALGSLGMGVAMLLQQRSARRRLLEMQRRHYPSYLRRL